MAAALRYLNQRYTIPDKVIGLLTDIGTEEFAHLEMIATMVYKLTKDATPEQLREAGLGDHYVNHDSALFITMPPGFRLPPVTFRQKAIRSRIYTRISQRRKKRGRPTNG